MLDALTFAPTGAGQGYILVPILIVGFILWAIVSHYQMTPAQRKERSESEAVQEQIRKAYRNMHDKNDTKT